MSNYYTLDVHNTLIYSILRGH
uniref:Similarity. Hypothetical start n=1 Tax=Microcystis aeruginosa (strain PCC 7806) TaxID=267872 RepID=A8YDG3_MICA7|nr:unnamed protein product [Microcystis aeruginosa PCC 7806]